MQLSLFRQDPLKFEIGQSSQRLVLSRRVVKHFEKHKQKRPNSLEAGGQLFARLSALPEVIIEQATGPRSSDFRTRTVYIPDRSAEQPEIDYWHKKGLHYVGDWHTHPEVVPNPSGSDSESIRESFVNSKHSLYGFLLIIVGTDAFPSGLYVSLNNAESKLSLVCIPS
ncbi:MAG: Mov34/MPN/PAD-1 family protein [Candidatus Acidiferrales bacterium]|jgi:integrative and conjugative element protein (TIGR02256 family)